MKTISLYNLIGMTVLAGVFISGPATAAEPNLADYTAYPVFTVNPVKPNILIMLDNSGSMNLNAYGSPKSNGGVVTDQPYIGTPYPAELTYRVATSTDDAEEYASGVTNTNNGSADLDLGGFSTNSPNTVGVRFQDIEIPQGAIITAAWLEFTVQRVPSGGAGAVGTEYADISLEIVGEDTDNAETFADSAYNISSSTDRPETSSTVTWNDTTSPTTQPWSPINDVKKTPSIVSIVQEIIDRSGWESGNAMAFKIRHDSAGQTGKRDAYSYDGSSSKAPTLHITYKMSEQEQLYYGYFNPDWFYTYSSNKYNHKYKKVDYDFTNSCWNVIYPSDLSNPGDESGWNSTCLNNAAIVSNNLWDGNWMNWATMRRIDVARKVIMGGLASSRQGNGNQVNYAEDPAQSSRYFNRYFNSSVGSAVTPYSTGNNTVMYGIDDGYIKVDTDNDGSPYDNNGHQRFSLSIDKQVNYDTDDFDDDQNLAGVMQKFWDKAYWGNEFFYYGTGTNREGGFIASSIGSNLQSLITDLQNTGADTYTPLSEAYYVAMQYFKQEDPLSSLGFHGSAIGAINNTNDPYYQDSQFVECAKSFVILLTDGASTKDGKLPSYLKDYDGDGDNTGCVESSGSNCDYSDGGTDFLDDVALYARTNDLRSDLDGDQNLILYTVYAFGTDVNAEQLLKDAARNGGFEDLNSNGVPDGDYGDAAVDRKEWDNNGDGDPDTYFEAQDGYKLEDQLIAAINDILERASSGTAVSVLATSSEGEGTLSQAYFRPTVNTTDDQISWVGYLQSLWVDTLGNIREDTNGNLTLDPGEDLIVQYHSAADGNTVIRRYAVDKIVCSSTDSSVDDAIACSGVLGTSTGYFNSNACYCEEDNYPEIEITCSSTDPLIDVSIACAGVAGDENGTFNGGDCLCDDGAIDEIAMDEITPIMEVGSILANLTDPDTERTIFTTLAGDGSESFYGGIEFSQSNASLLKPYFGVKDSTTWSYLGEDDATNGIDQDDRVSNLIRFIRGYEDGFSGETEIRSRLLPVNGTNVVWRLGDIVHSTPVTVGAPAEQFDLIYGDASYDDFYLKHMDREQIIYTGGNDGMLHAFTLWQFDEDNSKFVAPTAAASTEEIGTELWAYIPRTLLPHLKWLPRTDYTHVYYVDLKPRVADVKIFTSQASDGVHINGWGTILIGGLRMGGKEISVTDDFDYDTNTADTTETFTPSYFAIDITDPRNPKLLWEREYVGMDFTWSIPNVIKVGNKFFAVLGSGPDDYDGSSSSSGKVFIVDLATGAPYTDGTNEWRFELPEIQAFMGSAVSLDYGLNFNVDSVYIGQSYDSNTNANKTPDWNGSMYRITVPWSCQTSCSSEPYGTVESFDTNGDSIDDCECTYNDDPSFWTIRKLFDSPAPITAPGSLSMDFSRNIWLYFGTGRYLSQDDKTDVEDNYFYGLKDPFFNMKHSASGHDSSYNYAAAVGTDTYYLDQSKTLTMDENDLLDADPYSVIHPWGYYEAPAGDCSAVPSGAVGDIYNDGSCIAEYDWPESSCTSATAGIDDATACAGVTDGTLGLVNNGSYQCYCAPYQEPVWGCIEKVANGCDGVQEGVVADTTDYQSMYWQQTEIVTDGCVGVSFGDIVDDGNCKAEEISPPSWSYTERAAGNCTAAGVTVGMEGDLLEDGGSCYAGYWACTETVTDGCLSMDYTLTTGFLGTSGDGDYFGDGSCICTFTEDPVAMVTSSTSLGALTFSQQVSNARTYEGWRRTLPDPGERSVEKPALIGGITLFTSYVPSDDICAFGGNSYLYALYFETGTAYAEQVFTGGIGLNMGTPPTVRDRAPLGAGLASSPVIHVGTQSNNEAKVLIEESTGVIGSLPIDPAFNIRSGLQYWQQK